MGDETTSDDGYPSIRACPDLAALSRYAAVRRVAEAFRRDALRRRLVPDPPMARWEQAERFFDEQKVAHVSCCPCSGCRSTV